MVSSPRLTSRYLLREKKSSHGFCDGTYSAIPTSMGVLHSPDHAVPDANGKPPSRRIYKFGVFELRTETGELSKNGIRIRLQTRPCQVLQALLEKPGELVTREELCARLWPSGTFVDFESGLNTATNRLRSALGDSADSPRYIETLPRLGYRFVCPVTELNATHSQPPLISQRPSPEEQATAPTASLNSQRKTFRAMLPSPLRSRKAAAFAVFIVAILFLLTWYLRSVAVGQHPQHVFQQLTFYPGILHAARVYSPDLYRLVAQPF